METSISTISDLMDLWPSIADFASDIGCGYEAARQMRRRGSIPAGYWNRVVFSGASRGIAGVTLEVLALIAADTAGIPPIEIVEAAE